MNNFFYKFFIILNMFYNIECKNFIKSRSFEVIYYEIRVNIKYIIISHNWINIDADFILRIDV